MTCTRKTDSRDREEKQTERRFAHRKPIGATERKSKLNDDSHRENRFTRPKDDSHTEGQRQRQRDKETETETERKRKNERE